MTNPRRFLRYILPAVLVAFVVIHIVASFVVPPLRLPEYRAIDSLIVLEQNWTKEEINWYNHASQGGAFSLVVEYPWLRALERPQVPFLILNSPGKLMDPEYASRFGFLISEVNYERMGVPVRKDGATRAASGTGSYGAVDQAETGNYSWKPLPEGIDELPVGFTRATNWVDPNGKNQPPRVRDVVGFNCAACHTGQVDFDRPDGTRVGVRIEGGPALTHLSNFEQAVGASMLLTYAIPTRFNRFADEVLGEGHSDSQRDQLRADIKAFLDEGLAQKDFVTEEGINELVEGFGRLDALSRIGNFVFGKEIDMENYIPDDAPVAFPHIWDTPWFYWVQYNASIMQPMVRNAGEAMGVFARVDFDPNSPELFKSTVDVEELHEMEQLIRGDSAYAGLQSPNWPSSVFGAPNPDLVEKGEKLYTKYCQRCHFPKDIEDPRHRGNAHYWTETDPYGNQYLRVKEVSAWEIGTDPKVAASFIQRIVNLGELGEKFERGQPDYDPRFPMIEGFTSGGPALAFVVTKTIEKRYADLGIDTMAAVPVGDTMATMVEIYDGLRPNLIQARMIYKARPLNGIWATPPYLHNGSVPNMWTLLSPAEERPVAFYLGSKTYSPDSLGYVYAREPGAFMLDTRLDGNWNRGHEFRGSPDRSAGDQYWPNLGRGVIGPAFTPDERRQLIEFLKTL